MFKTNKNSLKTENTCLYIEGVIGYLLVPAEEIVGQKPKSAVCAKNFKFSCSKFD